MLIKINLQINGIFKQKDEIKILKTQRITFIIPYNKIIFLRDPPFIDNIKALLCFHKTSSCPTDMSHFL